MDSSNTVSVRRHKGSQQRQQLLARYHQSQLTQRDFAARHEIGLSTLHKWLRREGQVPVPPVKFQEVALPHGLAPWAVEVVSPNGWVVRVQNGFDAQSLPQLLRSLPC
jgi:hypothetical protein